MKYFISALHSESDSPPDGVEIALTTASLFELRNLITKVRDFSPRSRMVVLENPSQVTLRWLHGEPDSNFDDALPLLDQLSRFGGPACACDWDLSDEPWAAYGEVDPPDDVIIEVTPSYVRWVGFFGDIAMTSQGISYESLKEMNAR